MKCKIICSALLAACALADNHDEGPTAIGFVNHILPKHETDGFAYEVSKAADGHYDIENDVVDIVFHPMKAEAGDHDGHDHGEDEDEEDDHDGHDHGDRRRLDDHDGHDHGEETPEDLLKEMKAWYTGKTADELTAACTAKTDGDSLSLEIKDEPISMTCVRLSLNDLEDFTRLTVDLTGESNPIGEAGVEFFSVAFPHAEHEDDSGRRRRLEDHDGHDHEDHEDHEALQAQFNVVATSGDDDGEAHMKEATLSGDEYFCGICKPTPSVVGFVNHILPKHETAGFLYSVSKAADGHYDIENNVVDVVFHPMKAEAGDHDGHDHGDRRRLDDHDGHDHGEETPEDLLKEMSSWYTGKTNAELTSACTPVAAGGTISLEIKDEPISMTCVRMSLDNHFYSTRFKFLLTGESNPIGDAGVEFFSVAFPNMEEGEEGEEGDHDGHDHGDRRRLDDHDGHDHGEDTIVAQTGPQTQFNVLDAIDGDAHAKEATLTGDTFTDLMAAHDEHDEEEEPAAGSWEAILGAIVVNLCTLTGVALLPFMAYGITGDKGEGYSSKSQMKRWMTVSLSAFAAGAILSCALLLLMPEAIALLEQGFHDPNVDPHAGHDHGRRLDDHDGHDHSEGGEDEMEEEKFIAEIPIKVVWVWGTALMAGFLVSYFIDMLVPHRVEEEFAEGEDGGIEMQAKDPEKAIVVAAEGVSLGGGNAEAAAGGSSDLLEPRKSARERLINGILLGDFVHNIMDGFFMGFAFKTPGCGSSMGWTVTLATVAHEIPQELADFYLLISYGALSVPKALFYNFMCGTSVLWGTIIIWNLDVSDEVVGFFLALGAGVYIQIACAESMARAARNALTRFERGIMIIAFAVGATLVGLILLNHKHC